MRRKEAVGRISRLPMSVTGPDGFVMALEALGVIKFDDPPPLQNLMIEEMARAGASADAMVRANDAFNRAKERLKGDICGGQ